MKDTKELPYAQQSIDASDIQAVTQVLKKGAITRGEKCVEFEEAFATYCGASFAVAFNSGSSALLGAYFAVDTQPGDKILTTPNTYTSSVSSGLNFGAQPVFVDIDRQTGNVNLEDLEATMNRDATRGKEIILAVHFSGIPMDVERISGRISCSDTVVIEDAAHALGSCYPGGKRVGSCVFSDLTVFSLHPAKTMTTGEGGMVTTNSEELARRLRLYRNNCVERDARFLQEEAAPGYYEVVGMSGNFHLTDFQAALGLSQLQRLDKFVDKRRKLVARYRSLLQDKKGVCLFSKEQDPNTSFHLFVAQVNFSFFGKTRKYVMEALKDRGIGTQVHYIPLYRHPFYKKRCKDIEEYFPQMEEYYASALSLPLFYDMRLKDVDTVVSSLVEVLGS